MGRQLFEDALTGSLGRGRTRILVTHHIRLCLPRTKYAVLLENGTVSHAGFVEELRDAGRLDSILKEEPDQARQEDEEVAHYEANGTTKEPKDASVDGPAIDSSELDVQGSNAAPKKFVEDERRQVCVDGLDSRALPSLIRDIGRINPLPRLQWLRACVRRHFDVDVTPIDLLVHLIVFCAPWILASALDSAG